MSAREAEIKVMRIQWRKGGKRLQTRKLTAVFEAETSHAAHSAALQECWHGQHSEVSLALAAYGSCLVLPKGEK